MTVVEDIAYVRYAVPDLELMEEFLCDFGLVRAARTGNTLLMRAHGAGSPCHISVQGKRGEGCGVGLIARSREDLDKLADAFGAEVRSNVELGSGHVVTVRDPSGFLLDVLHGVEPLAAIPVPEAGAPNHAGRRQRIGAVVRSEKGPSHVMRLGHVVLKVGDVDAAIRFYGDTFNFKVTDSYYADDPTRTVAAFMRCGLGDRFTDHHTLALVASQNGQPSIDHCAFEVIDSDDLAIGGEHLRLREHKHAWGIGRHVEGSQVFDYWRDPFGNKIEHWTDGDLVNDSYAGSRKQLTPDGLSQWGPPLTPDFFV